MRRREGVGGGILIARESEQAIVIGPRKDRFIDGKPIPIPPSSTNL